MLGCLRTRFSSGMNTMVYLFEPQQRKWIQAARVSPELQRKQVHGIALQQSDIPAETVIKGRFELPDICSAADGFRFVSDRGRGCAGGTGAGLRRILPAEPEGAGTHALSQGLF